MRLVTVLFLWAFVVIATTASSSGETGVVRASSRPSKSAAVAVVRMAADSLLARAETMPTGGLAWRSAIQAPHYQTDRDVGAASIGEGLLAAYGVTRDARYLNAATAAGDFLLGIAEPDSGGLRWPDWADPDGVRSTTHYTSFDDGAAGISDYLLQLSNVTGELRFRTAALGGMRWLVAQAAGPSCPQTECSWRWSDHRSHRPPGSAWARRASCSPEMFADATGDKNVPRVRPRGRRPPARYHPGRTPSATAGLGAPGSVRDRVPRRLGRHAIVFLSDTPTTTPASISRRRSGCWDG